MRDLTKMEVLKQTGPACGTACLAMIVRFFTGDVSITQQDIDGEIRKLPNMFTATLDIMSYARSRGLQAEEYNLNSLQAVEDFIERGIPVMPLLDLTPDNALDFDQWHWVVVVAVKNVGSEKILVINNPWGQREEWSESKFIKEWACLRLLKMKFGYNNYFIAIAHRADSLPQGRAQGVAAANAITKGVADVLNGWATICHNHGLRGLSQIASGVLRLFFGVLCLIALNLRPMSKPASDQN